LRVVCILKKRKGGLTKSKSVRNQRIRKSGEGRTRLCFPLWSVLTQKGNHKKEVLRKRGGRKKPKEKGTGEDTSRVCASLGKAGRKIPIPSDARKEAVEEKSQHESWGGGGSEGNVGETLTL